MSWLGRVVRVLVVLGIVVGVAACRVDVVVDVHVDDGGGGEVVVAVGLDDGALARVGDLDRQLRVDDLTAAGWTVAEPVREAATTWVRATKPFSRPEDAAAVLGQVTGPGGALQGFAVQRHEGLMGTTTEVTGVVDLTGGPATFSDADLAALLGGDPFGGALDAVVADEGRPLADLVDVEVRVFLPDGDEPEVFAARFDDTAPVVVEASASQPSGLSRAALWLGVLALVVLAVVGALVARQVARRRHRAGAHFR